MIGKKLKTATPNGGHVFQRTRTTFELNQHIIKTNTLTKIGHEIFELDRDFMGTKLLTKFHKDWTIHVASRVFTYVRVVFAKYQSNLIFAHLRTNILVKYHQNCPPPSSHVIQLTGTIFELNSRIKETNVLSKYHENWAKNVTSTVEKCTALWLTYINKTNVLTNFHDDWAKIVTARVFTRKTATKYI
ncbi:hypothetical protein DPMN_073118 [Dreissena polymorpha]|uniref:Uncharacterized protein n=1 Tax=Dreissena polymorpha TaxID=45954 RepID=A0A9D4BYG2_DREPO|nr:hypothetical protein DPMN_073118 [Dreissena polymorpha]